MNYNESAENYLETILILSRRLPVVRSVDVATELNFKKSSVSVAMKHLREKEQITVTDAGFIYLTDTGFLLAKDLFRCVEVIRERIPAMGIELTAEEATDLVYTMVVNLPEHRRKQLASRE